MASLESGTYVIICKQGGHYVGRAPADGRAPGPKRVISLPAGAHAPHWIVEKLRNGHYILKTGAAPTNVVDKLLFAFPGEADRPEEWVIKHRENHGAYVYTIEKSSGSDGWVLPSQEPNAQIAVRPLVAPLHHYFLNELWTFIPSEISEYIDNLPL
ncbi:hypothetical protein BD779DRAFT_1541401 [Infundibulicybe gibba]|nr:hypothetical protein BD779DRAFT_1541401 [Infundibulicybe gibba]